MRQIKCKKGFTFIEFAIVTTVLGILKAIVVPFFQGSVAQARLNADLSNLRTLNSVTGFCAMTYSDGGTENFYSMFSDIESDERWDYLQDICFPRG